MRVTGLLLILFFFISIAVHSQNAHARNYFIQDSSKVSTVKETIAGKNNISIDSVLNSSGDIDEGVNDIFTNQMDSLVYSWQLKNPVSTNSPEVSAYSNYPTNVPDSVYIQRLMDAELVVKLNFNKTVKNYIKMYSERRRNQVEVMLGLSAYYFPIFEETLDKYNMPLELKYLPIIESALNPVARSRMGANGLWQFMYGTGKELKLEITTFVDERRDPVKASDAAARYLQKLYDRYEDWHLAIAAYNCGPGNVNKAIRRSGGKRNYWDIYYRLPRETRGYVPAFIAAMYVMEYYKEHELNPKFPEIPLDRDTVHINSYLHFDQIAATINISKEEIRALNPMYRRDVIPAKKHKTYPLILPSEKILDFIDKDTTIFAYEREKYFPNNTLKDPTQNSGTYYTPINIKGKTKVMYKVKSGDNVGFISSWFKVRSSDLSYWNNISRNRIRAGQKLTIYVPEKQKEKYAKVNSMSFAQKQASIGKSAKPKTKAAAKPLDSNFVYYKVRKGDTLGEISRKYAGISSDEIMRLNNLKTDRNLYIGQQLKIKRKM